MSEVNVASKAAYRADILSRELARLHVAVDSPPHGHSLNVMHALKFVFCKTINALYPGHLVSSADLSIAVSSATQNCDLQCNEAMKIGKALRVSPKTVADNIISNLPKDCEIYSEVSVGGPGFINIYLNNVFVNAFVKDILVSSADGNKLVPPPLFEQRKIAVDFSSPNIAKEMHVGHLRSTIIGDCICRTFEYLNCEVDRINHLGDWGTQFGMLINYLRKVRTENITKNNNLNYSIQNLQAFYKEAKKQFDSDENFKKESRQMVVALQSNSDASVVNDWKYICEISRNEFEKVYKCLDIKIRDMGESFYQPLMVQLVDTLKHKNVLSLEDGAYVWHVHNNNNNKEDEKKKGSPPLFVVKSDGGFTYDTSDLATIKYRLDNLKADWILYVIDSGQADHMNGIFKAAQLLNWYYPSVNRVEHVGFGVVCGADGKKFKTRSGETVKLIDLLNESVYRSLLKIACKSCGDLFQEAQFEGLTTVEAVVEKIKQSVTDEVIKEKTPYTSIENMLSTARTLGYACVKYSDLSHNRTLDYVFSFDKMLDDKGNTAVYLMYAVTRIKSIIKKSQVPVQQLLEYSFDNSKGVHAAQAKLAKKLVFFPMVVHRLSQELLPHVLCEYLYDLATCVMDFYENCYCIERVGDGELLVHKDRLLLLHSSLAVFNTGLKLLGIEIDSIQYI